MYENLNLKAWPFQTVPDAEYAKIWAGRTKTREQIERLLRKMQLIPKSGLNILWANFGMGKTHTLLHIKYLCQQIQKQIIPIYVVMPKRSTSFLELYREIIQALPYTHLGQQLIKLGGSTSGGIASHPIFRKSPGLVKALLALNKGDAEDSMAVMQWLSGQPGLSKSDLSSIGVTYRIKTSEDTLYALDSLVKLALFGNPNARLVIMVDEYQKIGELRPKILSEINASIHSLYNANPTGLDLILSFSCGKKENVDFMLSPELRSRAELQPIHLDTLTPEEAVEFVRDLLSKFRLHQDEANWSYPFSPDAVTALMNFIAKRKTLTPRRIMLYTGYSLEQYILDRDPGPGGIRFDELASYLDDTNLGASDIDSE